ncbi:hypothetical protein Tco_1376031 [Tanacetum coccineum]
MVPFEASCVYCEKEMCSPENAYKLRVTPPKNFGCRFFLWKETRLRQLMSSLGAPSAGPSTPPSYSSGPSTPPSYSSGPSTPPNYSPGSLRNAECSNCKHLRGKIISNEMEKLDWSSFSWSKNAYDLVAYERHVTDTSITGRQWVINMVPEVM